MPPKKGLAKAASGKKEKAAPAKKGAQAHGKANTVPGGGGGNLRLQLHALGLRIATVEGDGNCFFRAMCDQLEGKNGDFKKLREEVVDFIAQHREDFAPFVEDDVDFDKYLSRMRADGAWAGNIEVQAASLLRRVNVCIWQAGQAPWVVANWPGEAAAVHLAYEGELHYDSVRRAADTSAGPGGPFALGAVPAPSASAEAGADEPECLEEVLRGIPAGVADRAAAAEALRQMEGDVAAAIEFLIETWSSGAGAGDEADGAAVGADADETQGRTAESDAGPPPVVAAAEEGARALPAAAAAGGDSSTEQKSAQADPAGAGGGADATRAATGAGAESSGEGAGSSSSDEDAAGGDAGAADKGTGAGKESRASSAAAGGNAKQGSSARSALLERKKARKEEKEIAKQRRAAVASRRAAAGEGEPAIALPPEEQAALLARSLCAVRI